MKFVNLGSIVKISKGKKSDIVTSTRSDKSVRFIQIDDLRNDDNLKYTDPKGVAINLNDIVIAWDGANAGTVGYGLEGIIGSTLAKLEILDNKFSSSYLGRYLKSKSKYLRDRCTGATIPHISGNVLRNLQVPIITIDEQEIIVKYLDQADLLRQKRKQSLTLLDEYLKSTFYEMFGDPINNEKNWEIKKLGEVADIASGVTKGRNFGNKETVVTPYMRVANVQDENIDLHEIKTIEVLPGDVEKYRLISGDLLLTEGGDPDKLGRGGIWRGEIDNCIHQNHIFRVRLNSQIALPEYISAQIGSRRGKNYFLRSAKQTTGIATINITQLKNYPALIPPINVQAEYVNFFNGVRDLKKIMLAQAKELDNQFQALMQKYFIQSR